MNRFCIIAAAALSLFFCTRMMAQEIVGTHVVPHHFADEMRWRKPPNPELSARLDLFLMNTQDQSIELSATAPPVFDDRTSSSLLEDSWAWHDTPESWQDGPVAWPPRSLTVFSVNGKSSNWGLGTRHELKFTNGAPLTFKIEKPTRWLSSITFLSEETKLHPVDSARPNKLVTHLVNAGKTKVRLQSVKLWLPRQGDSHHVFHPARMYEVNDLACFPRSGVIESGDKGGFSVSCEPLPLGYVVVEVIVSDGDSQERTSLWARLRIKREVFDISGGWIASDLNGRNSLSIDQYLMLLKRMHINTGQIEEVGGYTDNPSRYAKWPIKRFNRLWPLSRYDTEEMLPTIHAVEFLGEPQYGGGRPVPPQEVWSKLAPYQSSRLPTSITLSEEHAWRFYAGLSDYPHYDAYRVIAPAADSWRSYDRWSGDRIRWGAPLETIGTMTRSLREHSRPGPIAYWSQGAHDGWGSWLSQRRASPTADELRSQAWHGLANRVTSLYWFNLSLKSLAKFPDLIEPITQINREIRVLDEFFLNGDAYDYRRLQSDGQPIWDLASIATPTSILLTAHDLSYIADKNKREFVFSQRPATLEFKLPGWLAMPLHAFRVDADGTHDVTYSVTDSKLSIQGSIEVVGIFIATTDKGLRSRIDTRHAQLLEYENTIPFDPVNDKSDLKQLIEYAAE